MTTATRSAVTEYAEAVIAGTIVTGQLVRLACERHIRDLETGAARGLYFDEDEAQAAIDFFGLLRLPDGEAAGEPFMLQLWQMFIIGSLYGWFGADGRRRFRYAFVEVARANGKSPLAGGIGLKGLMHDGEPGAQIYSAATTRDQAKIVFNDAVSMAEQAKSLWPRLLKTVNNLAYPALRAYFRPLSADASKMDGLRVHVGLVDEVHEHPDDQVITKLRTGMKSSQPLLFMITTAGFDKATVCWDEHEHAVRVLEGVIDNDSYFAYVATLDPDDDWTDEANWPKANPSLGVTVRIETLRDECELAKQIPSQQNSFKRLRLNIWTQQATRWLTADFWERGSTRGAALKGRPCFAGLHATVDSAALVLWFPDPENGGGDALSWFFVPEELLADAEKTHGVPWSAWADDGYVDVTEGDVTDYETLRSRLNELHEQYDIQEVGVFRHGTVQLQTQLEGDGLTVVPMSNGFPSMAGACEEVERLLKLETLRHGGNPVLRWQASNLSIKTNPEQQKRPDQEGSGGPIGGMLALLMAMGRAVLHQEEPDVPLQIFFGSGGDE